MEEIFNNAQHLKFISPNAEVISNLKLQKNWAVGICITLLLGGAIFIIIEHEKKKKIATPNE